jgi:hypothetical protein
MDFSWKTIPGTVIRLLITSRGDGSGVAYFTIAVSSSMTISLTGAARFYSNTLGTLDESTTWTVTPSGLKTRYIKCTSGTSYMTFMPGEELKLTQFGHAFSISGGNPAWHFDTVGGNVANVPSLNCSDWVFPNCTDIYSSYGSIVLFPVDISQLSSNLELFTNYMGGSMTGSLSDIPSTNCTRFSVGADNTIDGDLVDLPSTILELNIMGQNTVTGDLADLPTSINIFQLTGSNTVYGDIADIPSSLDSIYLIGNNVVTGDIANFKSSLTSIELHGSNTVYGDIADVLDTVTNFTIDGDNTIEGSIVNVPSSIVTFRVYGNNTLTGGFTGLPSSLRTFYVFGSNTINGDVADITAGVTTFSVSGGNTINGNVTDITDTITSFVVAGNNTLTGTLANLPSSIVTFSVSGSNTISGDIATIPSTCRYLKVEGSNTIDSYTGRTWTLDGYSMYLAPVSPGGLSAAEVDQLLIDLDDDCAFTNVTYHHISLTGTNAAPTATSLTARNSLIAKGVTLTLNS